MSLAVAPPAFTMKFACSVLTSAPPMRKPFNPACSMPYCPTHNEPIVAFSVTKIADIALEYPEGTKLQILSPIVHNEKGTHKDILAKILSQGFERVRVDGEMFR